MLLDENTGTLVTKNGIIKLNRNEIMFFIYLIYSKKNIYSYKEFTIWIYGVDDNDCKLFYNCFRQLLTKIRKKIKEEELEIITIDNYKLVIRYNISKEMKNKFKIYNKKIKIEQLEQDIKTKQEQIKLLKEEIEEWI